MRRLQPELKAILRVAAVYLSLVISLYWIPVVSLPGVITGVFIVWLLAPALPTLAGALWLRLRFEGIVAAVATLFLLALILPDLQSATPPPDAPRLRLLSANLLMVHPEPLPLAEAILAADADVLLLQEVSDRWVDALRESGIDAAYPYGVLESRPDSFGVALLSRLPLESSELTTLGSVPTALATLRIGDTPIDLLSVHTLPPRNTDYLDAWVDQMARLERWSRSHKGAHAIIGDLNATQHSHPYRALLDAGLHAAHRECGHGLATTFPNGVFPLPPVRLDHALLSPHLVCAELRELHGTGSDHSALILDVIVP